MADISDNSTASNYSIQPGSNHPPIPDPIDVRDHDARDMPDMPWAQPSANYDLNNKGREALKTREYGSIMSKRSKNN